MQEKTSDITWRRIDVRLFRLWDVKRLQLHHEEINMSINEIKCHPDYSGRHFILNYVLITNSQTFRNHK